MRVELSQAGKRYNREWIFRNFTYQFSSGKTYAITGPNGSGKSTLLQAISGQLQLSEGSITYSNKQKLNAEDAFRHVSLAAPYMEVIEEMTLLEFLQFHGSFKPLLPSVSADDAIRKVHLEHAINKQIRYFSSGMKQRVKLAQAILSDTDIVLLDEPCSNLDSAGIEIYQALVRQYCTERLVIISSNDPVEYDFNSDVISVLDYKWQPLRAL